MNQLPLVQTRYLYANSVPCIAVTENGESYKITTIKPGIYQTEHSIRGIKIHSGIDQVRQYCTDNF